MKFFNLVFTLLTLSVAISAEANTLKGTVCKYALSEREGLVSMREILINDNKFYLTTEQNPIAEILWKFDGEVNAVSYETDSAGQEKKVLTYLGHGDQVRLTRNGSNQCQDLILQLPSHEFEVSSVQNKNLPVPFFCGDVDGYTGPCLLRTIVAKATIKILSTGKVFKLKSKKSEFRFEGAWH